MVIAQKTIMNKVAISKFATQMKISVEMVHENRWNENMRRFGEPIRDEIIIKLISETIPSCVWGICFVYFVQLFEEAVCLS